MEDDPLVLAESLAAIAEKTGWTLDYMTAVMSQRQLMLMLRGWNRLSDRFHDETEEGEFDFPEPNSGGGPLDPSWMTELAQERGLVVVEK